MDGKRKRHQYCMLRNKLDARRSAVLIWGRRIVALLSPKNLLGIFLVWHPLRRLLQK